MSAVQLGPKAALLLGLLSKPVTVSEILNRVRRLGPRSIVALGQAGGLDPDALRDALRGLDEGGAAEVRRLLGRLEEFGLVRRVAVGSGTGQLWWRA